MKINYAVWFMMKLIMQLFCACDIVWFGYLRILHNVHYIDEYLKITVFANLKFQFKH